MTDETIVAVFDTAEHAAAAVRDLEAAGVPSDAITRHAEGGLPADTSTKPAVNREQGFWANLFGGAPEREHDTTVFDRSLAGGSVVLTVKAPEQHITQVMDILERHNPIDIDEQAAGYGASSTTTTTTTATPLTDSTTAGTMAAGTMPVGTTTAGTTPAGTTTAGTMAAGARAGDGEAIQLSEEELVIAKRAVNRGTTRVRRYVVETPVEEQVTLRDETVSVERRPVTDARPATTADFTDKVIEVTESGEEAVVGKTARVTEEVVIQKEAADRTETVRDTVRREDVEITKEPGTATATPVTGTPVNETPATAAPGTTKPAV
ncbi:YsnF/AvaK domain-containing protein [Rhodopila sp.]|uniref:YsnF/AvaK domain-containing protein n=1 Tax=Rhodopila sp. TaxID=2480087 RepID=UPI003D0B67C2